VIFPKATSPKAIPPGTIPSALTGSSASTTTAPEQLAGPAAYTHALLHDFGGYFLSLGLLSLGGILLLPMITASLSPAELGLFSLVDTALTQGLTLGLLGLKFSYLYYYAHIPSQERPRLLGNTLILCGAGSLVVGILLAGLFGSTTVMAQFDAVPLPMAWLLVPLQFIGATQVVLLTELRAARHVKLAGVIAVAQLALLLTCSYWMVVKQRYGLPGLLGAQLIAQGSATLGALVLLLPRLALDFDIARSQRLLRYGLPMMGSLTLRYALDTICRFLLAALVSIEAAGLFLVVNRVTMLFEGLLATPFLMAFGGLVHHALRKTDAAQILGRISSVMLAAGAGFALILLALREPLFLLLAHDPLPGSAGLFALLLLSRLVMTVRSPLTAGMLRDGRTGWSATNSLLALVLFLAMIWPAATLAGATGTAFAMLAANLIATLQLAVAARRQCLQHLQPEAWALAALLAVATAAIALLGSLPLALWGVILAAAGWLSLRLLRHVHVMDRL
jgi:O-antigen/teichoic acid export membrane protein